MRLIELAQHGDAAAWETIVQQHREGVFRLAYLILGNAQEAEDIMQETFIAAYRHLHRFEAERLLRPWLLRIASNLARNRQRSVGRYLGALQRFLHQMPASQITIEDLSHQQAEAQLLWQAVRRLNKIDQEVIYLRFFLDLSVTETADVLDVAPGTIKSRLHRALNRLRSIIEHDYPSLKPIPVE